MSEVAQLFLSGTYTAGSGDSVIAVNSPVTAQLRDMTDLRTVIVNLG
jgi:hypothetical protein